MMERLESNRGDTPVPHAWMQGQEVGSVQAAVGRSRVSSMGHGLQSPHRIVDLDRYVQEILRSCIILAETRTESSSCFKIVTESLDKNIHT